MEYFSAQETPYHCMLQLTSFSSNRSIFTAYSSFLVPDFILSCSFLNVLYEFHPKCLQSSYTVQLT
jgi:hypothetical protein